MLFAGASTIKWIITARRHARMRHAQEDIDESEPCLGCGRSPLDEIHRDAYRCPACQYEQGPGWQRRVDQQRLEELMMLPPEEASKLARGKLREARTMLLAAGPALSKPIATTNKNDFDIAPGLLDAVGQVVTAWTQVQESSMVDNEIRQCLQNHGFDATAPPPDIGQIMEPWTETHIHWQTHRLGDQALSLRKVVELTMKQLGIAAQ
jgi:hypothetical protein